MLSRTLAARSVAVSVMQTHTSAHNAGNQCSMLLARLTRRKMGPCALSKQRQVIASAHIHSGIPSGLHKKYGADSEMPSSLRKSHLHRLQTSSQCLQPIQSQVTASAHIRSGTPTLLLKKCVANSETPSYLHRHQCHLRTLQMSSLCLHPTQPQIVATAQHPSTSSALRNHGLQSGMPSYLQRHQNHLHPLQTSRHHLQTSTMSPLSLIATRSLTTLATRGLPTLSSTFPSKRDAHNRNSSKWPPRAVVVVGGVAVGVRGIAKDKGGFKNLHGRISSLQLKKRTQRKKKKIQEESEEEWQVTAYATADEYDLERLLNGLTQQGLYVAAPITPEEDPDASGPPLGSSVHPYTLSSSSESKPNAQSLPDPSEVLHVRATYRLESEPREIYFFQSGAVVFWNVAELERNSVLRFLRAYQAGGHDGRTVMEESESLTYTYHETPSRTKLVRDTIFLNPEGPTDLEKYTFSNALAMSVQLGIWEAALDEYIDNIEYVSEELSKRGVVVLSEQQVLQRMGQLFALRHLVNLSSDLLDVPDFYWEHENLEQLYRKTSEYLSVSKRTSVMNVKLSHCVELMELLKSHLNERHSARLEWIIIILIMVEVGFEVLHFLERLL